MLTQEQLIQKRLYRDRFTVLNEFIKIRFFLDILKIDPGAFSRFLKGQDTAISMDDLESLDNLIKDRCISDLVRFYDF